MEKQSLGVGVLLQTGWLIMTVEQIRKELAEFGKEFSNKREALLAGIVGDVALYNTYGVKVVGSGFDTLLTVAAETYGSRATKEWLLDFIERQLEYMDGSSCRLNVYMQEHITPSEVLQNFVAQLLDIHYEIHKEAKLPFETIPYRSPLLSYDKRRNYKGKNYWNRIRSRCF